MKRFFPTIIVFFFCIEIFSQHPLSVQLTEKDGLPDIEFYDIVEDKKGFIWLAADKGLYRYDGKSFKNYSHSKKRGLSVFGLKFDHKGRLWCNNISGQYFYVENDSLHLFTDLKPYTRGQLGTFFFHNNDVIVTRNSKLLEINIDTKKVTDRLPDNAHSIAAFKNKDTLFYILNDSLRYVTSKNQYEEFCSVLNLKPKELGVNNTFRLNNSFILQSVDNKTYQSDYYLSDQHQFKLLSANELNLNAITSKIYTENDTVWFCTKNGVIVYQYHNRKFKPITTYFKGIEITAMLKDKNQNYWFTSHKNGVYIIPNIHIKQYDIDKKSINISALEKLNDQHFISGSTSGELSIIDIDSGNIKKNLKASHQKINKIAFNGVRDIYVSLDNKGIILDLFNCKMTPSKFMLGNAKGLSIINNDTLVYGGFSAVSIINAKENSFSRIGHRRSYTTHYNTLNKKIYAGYIDGFEYYDQDYTPNAITFKDNPIFAIDIDNTSDGTVWVSTFKDGIIGIQNGKAVYNYTTENGLLSNQTGTIEADGNDLWIATNKGIQLFDTQQKIFQNLTQKDGITSFNISDIAIFKHKVVFGSNKGLFQIDKEKAFKTVQLSDFYFTKVLVEDKEVQLKDHYELASDVNKIQFQFHTNGYLSEESSIYQYRLLGASNEWSKLAENVHQITFNSLSAGSYVFELKTVSKIDNQETPVKAIKIDIKKPFYQEWWFYSSGVLFFVVLTIAYYKKKLKKKEQEQQKALKQIENEKELVFLKLENLRSQMNPHFIFNALNSIQDYILLNQKNLAGDYLGKFADLIRMYLNHSNKGYISLSEEITALEQYLELEKLRFEDSFSYAINIDKTISTEDIEIPTMLIQPYIENALKHGLLHKKDDKKLTISFSLKTSNQYLTCIITDNGIGRIKAAELQQKRSIHHTSFATKANQDRLQLLNYGRTEKIGVEILDLYTKNSISEGTKVIIKIPYKQL